MTLSIGARLGRYEILAPLGSGGMAEVYRARDTRLERMVAVKVLSENLRSEPDFEERFKREAKAVAALCHPNIVTIHDVAEQAGIWFMVMELVDGQNLRTLIARSRLEFDHLVEIGVQIADALSAVHSIGLLHRDVKPANILVTAAGVAKLADFGIAKRLIQKPGVTTTGLTISGNIIGTPNYMSPEQARGEALDEQSDVFSLGAVLYEAATGKRPFGGEYPLEILAAIATADPEPPRRLRPTLPPAFESLLLRALAKDKSARLPSAAALRDALRATTATAAAAEVGGITENVGNAASPTQQQRPKPTKTPRPERRKSLRNSPGSGGRQPAARQPGAPARAERIGPARFVSQEADRSSGFHRIDLVLVAMALLAIPSFLIMFPKVLPAAQLRLLYDRDGVASIAKKRLIDLTHDQNIVVRADAAYVNFVAGEMSIEGDPQTPIPDFQWSFEWVSPSTTSEYGAGQIFLDERGDLRRFTTSSHGTAGTKLKGIAGVSDRARQLARDVLNFDVEDAVEESVTKYDESGNAYASFRWTAKQRDERGVPTASADLWGDGIKSLARSYAHYHRFAVQNPVWGDKGGGLLFIVVITIFFFGPSFRRFTAVGRALVVSAIMALGLAAIIQPWELIVGAMPEWGSSVLVAALMFLACFIVWVTGEDRMRHGWPEKMETSYHPFSDGWLSPHAARTVLRGWLFGLGTLLIYAPALAALSALQIGSLRTWLLTWTLQSPSPAFLYFAAVTIFALLLLLGPIGLPIALLHGRLRPLIVIALTVAIRLITFHASEATRATPAMAQGILVALTGAWFAAFLYYTDMLATFVAMFVFEGLVGTLWLLRVNSAVSVLPYVAGLTAIGGIGVFSLISLYHWHAAKPASSAGALLSEYSDRVPQHK